MGYLWIFLFVGLHLSYQGISAVDTVSVSVNEGDSVTLNTGVIKNQQERINWYYDDTRIAQINGDLSKICTDVQCNEANERFRDRLKLDNHTGSLTIMNITNTDSGKYELKITSDGKHSPKIFSVSVHGVSAAERDEVKRKSVKEGESVTLDPGVTKHSNDVMKQHFNDTDITGAQNSGLSSGVVAGIVAGVLLVSVAAAVAVIYYHCRISRKNIVEKRQSSDPVDPVAIPVSEVLHFLQTGEKQVVT